LRVSALEDALRLVCENGSTLEARLESAMKEPQICKDVIEMANQNNQRIKELNERVQAMGDSTKSSGLLRQAGQAMRTEVAAKMDASEIDQIYCALDECKLEAKALVRVVQERFSDMCLEWRSTEHAVERLMKELHEGGALLCLPLEDSLESASGRPSMRTNSTPGSSRHSVGRTCNGVKSHTKKICASEEWHQGISGGLSHLSSECAEDDACVNKWNRQLIDLSQRMGEVEDDQMITHRPRPLSPHFEASFRPTSPRFTTVHNNTSTIPNIPATSESCKRGAGISTTRSLSTPKQFSRSNSGSPTKMTREERQVQARRSKVALRAEVAQVRFTGDGT